MTIYCVFSEISDQYGTSALVALCTTPELANEAGEKESSKHQFGRRFYVKPMELISTKEPK